MYIFLILTIYDHMWTYRTQSSSENVDEEHLKDFTINHDEVCNHSLPINIYLKLLVGQNGTTFFGDVMHRCLILVGIDLRILRSKFSHGRRSIITFLKYVIVSDHQLTSTRYCQTLLIVTWDYIRIRRTFGFQRIHAVWLTKNGFD